MNLITMELWSVKRARLACFAAASPWLLALSCVLSWVGPVAAVERPFKGSIDGQFVANPTPDPTIYVGGAQAVGKATQVGAFTKVTSDVSNIATGWVQGSFTMTASNGDHITGFYSGFILFGDTSGAFSWLLDATITGGSGRFSTAIGAFFFIAEGEAGITDGVVYGKYTETFEGTIDY